ncbi:MAG: hypothetical protein VB089_00785 [Anaerolineaceae bacterium]|nr:hypothetical protein [Anaerolineaceae bacterium]
MTDLVLIAVYLGYAAVWGQLISLSRQVTAWPAAGFGLLVVAPASLGIPGPWATRVLVWMLAAGVSLAFTYRPACLPGWLWGRQFIYFYFGGVMLSILAWAAQANPNGAVLWIGIPALLAGVLVLRRAYSAMAG